MDCSGLIIVAAKIANLAPPGFSEKDWAGYSRRPSGELLRKNLSKFARRVNGGILAAEVEDILLMNVEDVNPNHLAVVTEKRKSSMSIIHSFVEEKGVIEHRLNSKWMNYVSHRGVYRLEALDNVR